MRVPRWVSSVVLAVVGVGLGAVVVAEATAAWLFDRYRPTAPGVDRDRLDGTARSSLTWVDGHGAALVVVLVLLVLLVIAAPAVVAEEGAGPLRPVLAGLVAALGAVAGLVGWATTGMVAWDQIALREVTVATDVGGWRAAAFDDGVLFVIVDDVEVSPTTYGATLVVHLVTPLVVALALVVVGLLVRSARRRDAALAAPAPPRSVGGW